MRVCGLPLGVFKMKSIEIDGIASELLLHILIHEWLVIIKEASFTLFPWFFWGERLNHLQQNSKRKLIDRQNLQVDLIRPPRSLNSKRSGYVNEKLK